MLPEIVKWDNNNLFILDQRKIPMEISYLKCSNYQEVASAIEKMAIRGAPAIGIAAAYGVALASLQGRDSSKKALERLSRTRPTAVNLFWALDRMEKVLDHSEEMCLFRDLLAEADHIYKEDIEINMAIGQHGATLVQGRSLIMTHCNAGALATGGYGTALGVIRKLQEDHGNVKVYACETRPVLQGSRLTSWELQQDGIDVTVICDNMAALVMKLNYVEAVIVGADRVASNGDVANKVGTYGLAVLASFHKIPFLVASPISTFDMTLETGRDIPIEERDGNEIRIIGHNRVIPDLIRVYNPAFDVTPAHLISAIITEKGCIFKPDSGKISTFLKSLKKE
ncbi:MAG: S-methyl-5-thioribose-1-phosphate isomerase [Synergistales bacterium]|nr:S-methyl-5-thioribose-1-phosphate isomerase [Synergistales bacterium]